MAGATNDYGCVMPFLDLADDRPIEVDEDRWSRCGPPSSMKVSLAARSLYEAIVDDGATTGAPPGCTFKFVLDRNNEKFVVNHIYRTALSVTELRKQVKGHADESVPERGTDRVGAAPLQQPPNDNHHRDHSSASQWSPRVNKVNNAKRPRSPSDRQVAHKGARSGDDSAGARQRRRAPPLSTSSDSDATPPRQHASREVKNGEEAQDFIGEVHRDVPQVHTVGLGSSLGSDTPQVERDWIQPKISLPLMKSQLSSLPAEPLSITSQQEQDQGRYQDGAVPMLKIKKEPIYGGDLSLCGMPEILMKKSNCLVLCCVCRKLLPPHPGTLKQHISSADHIAVAASGGAEGPLHVVANAITMIELPSFVTTRSVLTIEDREKICNGPMGCSRFLDVFDAVKTRCDCCDVEVAYTNCKTHSKIRTHIQNAATKKD